MARADQVDVSVKFPLSFSLVCFLGLLALTFAFHYEGASDKDTILFFAAGAAGVGTIVTGFYTARTLNLALAKESRLATLDLERDAYAKRIKAMEYGARWNDPTMFHVRDIYRQVVAHRDSKANDLEEFIVAKETNVIHILNFFEEICIVIENELADNDIMCKQFKGIILTSWPILSAWIEKTRKALGSPRIWCEFETTFHKLKK